MVAFGRQSGKTTYGINKSLKNTWQTRNGIFWFIEPTFKQAKVIWRRINRAIGWNKNIVIDKNKTDLYFQLRSGSYLFCQSGEVLDNLRIETLDGCVIDEHRQQNPDLWPLVIRPMLSTTGGGCDFLSTPNGFDEFFELHEYAKHDTTGRWAAFHAPSTANPLFTKEEYEAAMNDMSEPQFAQEIEAQFRDLTSGKAYLSWGEWNMVEQNPFAAPGQLWTPHLPLVIGLDFNISPMSWHIGQFRNKVSYWGDRIWLEGSHTAEAALELVEKVKGHAAGIIIIGDATGKASQRAAASKSDYDILFEVLKIAEIKYTDMTPESNPRVKDRVNTVNARLRNAAKVTSCYVNPVRCKELVRDGQRVIWKKGADATLDKSNRLLTHAFDSIGYPICVLAPLEGVNEVGRMGVIRR